MPVFDIDLTTAGGPPDGTHVATVNKVDYEAKVGEKWNKDGIKVVSAEEAKAYPAEQRRLHITLSIPGHGNLWHDLYFMESALGFMKQFCQAAGIPLKNPDCDSLVGKQVLVTLATKSDPTYGDRQNIISVKKV